MNGNCGRRLGWMRRMVPPLLLTGLFSAGAVAPRSFFGVTPAAAQNATDPQEREAARIARRINAELKDKLPGIEGVDVRVEPFPAGQFAVFLSGELDNRQQTGDVKQLANALLDELRVPKRNRYYSGLKIKEPAPPPPAYEIEQVPLFYYRQADRLKAVLDAMGADEKSELHGLVVQPVGENRLSLYGDPKKITRARQFLAVIDLPVPSVQMEIWGLQISSSNPEKMALVLQDVRASIERAREAVRDTYTQLQTLAAQQLRVDPPPPTELKSDAPPRFRDLLTNEIASKNKPGLGYIDALKSNRALSITDILLFLIAPEEYRTANVAFANGITEWLTNDKLNRKNYSDYVDKATKLFGKNPDRRYTPFKRFFEHRGLLFAPRSDPRSWWGVLESEDRAARNARLDLYVLQARTAVLAFAFEYARTIEEPGGFSPYYLQQTAGTLNSRMQTAVDLLMQDLYDLFLAPTLEDIRLQVEKFREVEYAQVGRTSVASLSGAETTVEASSVSAFDVTPPLPASELFSKLTDPGRINPEQQAAVLAEIAKDRTARRELSQGVSLVITPNVLRNASSAELTVHLTVGDPQGATREEGVRPLSRVAKHELASTVYLNALDLFDLSTFSSEAALEGGRGYFPLIGPVWKGVFGDVPVLGNLFSWKRSPRHVYHQSVLLSTAIINPTAMGVALLHPHRSDKRAHTNDESAWKERKNALRDAVRSYGSITDKRDPEK